MKCRRDEPAPRLNSFRRDHTECARIDLVRFAQLQLIPIVAICLRSRPPAGQQRLGKIGESDDYSRRRSTETQKLLRFTLGFCSQISGAAACLDRDQKIGIYFLGYGQLFYRAIDHTFELA
jgi:hypothetical protein